MPTYRYRCNTCGEEFEVWQSIKDPALAKHEGVGENQDCGGDLVKVLSAAGIVLKGSGFYKTDSRSNGKGAKREASSDSSGSGSKDSGSKDSGSTGSGSKDSGSKDSGSKSSGSGDSGSSTPKKDGGGSSSSSKSTSST